MVPPGGICVNRIRPLDRPDRGNPRCTEVDSRRRARRPDLAARVTESPHDALGLSVDDLLAMHRAMVTARLLDEAAFRQNRMGRAPFVVPVSGHEGCQIGTAWPMRKGIDIWLPYYRDLGVVLVAGMTPYEVFLGIFAKADDPSSGGRQMPAHWGSRRLGIISGSSPIATQVPHASGIAYAAKYRGEDAVVACWFGEGATSEGDWHEGLNFAGIHKLPVVFVCENNHYAISVPQSKQMAVENVADRAPGYGFPGVVVDGNDVLACYGAMKEAHERARRGEGPTLIECKTYRYFPHTSDDDDKSYRSREEVEEARTHDPIAGFERYLADRGILDLPGAASVRAEVKEQIDGAITAAWEAPDPEPESALGHVFAESP
ncbi:MAG: thiamine pyrophosphate-dependent dehydrogenase E1 component subunit alpha [Actinobacteria bacterium]|nr:thiamine pyrophosphate-dependent dehydrogenase E1 component subunit alpha [Actinomycetota bacterium]